MQNSTRQSPKPPRNPANAFDREPPIYEEYTTNEMNYRNTQHIPPPHLAGGYNYRDKLLNQANEQIDGYFDRIQNNNRPLVRDDSQEYF